MITVCISINRLPIATRSARNIGREIKKEKDTNLLLYRYKLDDGTIIKHYKKDGAIELAIKMLKTIKEI
jgi:IS4 transposase